MGFWKKHCRALQPQQFDTSIKWEDVRTCEGCGCLVDARKVISIPMDFF